MLEQLRSSNPPHNLEPDIFHYFHKLPMTYLTSILVLVFVCCAVLRPTAGQPLVTSLTITNATTYADVVRDVTTIHRNSSSRFAKIESDRVNIYTDNFCYRRISGNDESFNKREGVCLRYFLRLSSSADGKNETMYFFVTEDGIHHNNQSNGSYTRISGDIRRVRWYEDYIEEQLELRKRILLCMDALPNDLRLDERARQLASTRALEGCQEVCLAKSTLQKVYHIRLSPWRYSVVYCLEQVCASAYHVVKVDGKFLTMGALCNMPDYHEKCTQRVEEVAKALLQTQRIGDINVTFVASQSATVRTFLLGIQLVIDHLEILISLLLFAAIFRTYGGNKHHKMANGPIHPLANIYKKGQWLLLDYFLLELSRLTAFFDHLPRG